MGARIGQRIPSRAARLFARAMGLALLLVLPRSPGRAAGRESAAPAASLPAESFPALARGQIVDPVPCLQRPGQTYAVYLPSAYTAERAWPVLFVLDARGRGALAAERFRAAAERLGYLVISSNQSRSDGPDAPNFQALQALWPDSHARFHIDDRRIYGAGFSGTVRSLCSFARAVPGLFAGIVGSAAGFPLGEPPRPGDRFAFFGAVGNQDFNFYELLELEPRLAAAGVRHRIEVFEGGHQWPPEPVAERALVFMDLRAMQDGTLKRDSARITAAFQDSVAQARAAEAAGDWEKALRSWSEAADDAALSSEGANQADTQLARARQAALAADPGVQRELTALAEQRRRDASFLESAPLVLSGRLPPPAEPKALTVEQAIERLRIPELRAQAQSHKAASRQDRLSAQRILNSLRVFSRAYLPQQLAEKQRYDRVAFVLSIALAIDPDDPELYYRRAAAQARLGDRTRALADLRRASAHGWRDVEALAADSEFVTLRKDSAFQQLIQSLRTAAR